MSEEQFSRADFLQNDDRYPFDAYMFVREGLNYAVEVLQMGQQRGPINLPNMLEFDPDSEGLTTDLEALGDPQIGQPPLEQSGEDSKEIDRQPKGDDEPESGGERHLTGQQLCEALRKYALHQYGLMARVVLANWGIYETQDFGEIVYNMIDAGWMKKSPRDRKEHFSDVYDFSEALEQQFEIGKSAIHWPS